MHIIVHPTGRNSSEFLVPLKLRRAYTVLQIIQCPGSTPAEAPRVYPKRLERARLTRCPCAAAACVALAGRVGLSVCGVTNKRRVIHHRARRVAPLGPLQRRRARCQRQRRTNYGTTTPVQCWGLRAAWPHGPGIYADDHGRVILARELGGFRWIVHFPHPDAMLPEPQNR